LPTAACAAVNVAIERLLNSNCCCGACAAPIGANAMPTPMAATSAPSAIQQFPMHNFDFQNFMLPPDVLLDARAAFTRCLGPRRRAFNHQRIEKARGKRPGE